MISPIFQTKTLESDHFDRLPDTLLLLIFNNIGDVKTLGRCSLVSKRFHSLVTQVENVVVTVDCVFSDDDASSGNNYKARTGFSTFFRIFVKPFRALGELLGPRRSSLSVGSSEIIRQGGVTHHSPTRVLRNFNGIRTLRIEFPSGELGVDDGVLLKWRAEFGSTLDKCIILGASSVENNAGHCDGGEDDNGIIPESFCTNGGLKLRLVWTISSLIAASGRHYLLQSIIAEHKSLDSLVLSDADGQGVLCMNRDQLKELRVKPLCASAASKRTLVPALNIRLWYAAQLELPDGVVLKGATLVAMRPSDEVSVRKEVNDCSWVLNAFEEKLYGTAARMLVKRRTYHLEMDSF